MACRPTKAGRVKVSAMGSGKRGQRHFLTRRLEHVGTEMSLKVLAYNLKRVLQILGAAKAIKAMRLVGA